MNEHCAQGLTAAVLAALGAYFHQLEFPVILLIIAMVLDYATGMASAWMHGQLSSKTGIVGILKKIMYMVGVAVAVLVDMILRVAADRAGLGIGMDNVFALLVSIWLTLNECISILENLDEMGVPVPEFLLKIIQKLKRATEEKGGQDEEKENAERE